MTINVTLTMNDFIDCEPAYTYTANCGDEYLIFDFHQFGYEYAVFKNEHFVEVTSDLYWAERFCCQNDTYYEPEYNYDPFGGWTCYA